MQSFFLSPRHNADRFQRTIRIEGREPRLVEFSCETSVELDKYEVVFMQPELEASIILLAGCKPPVPPKPEPAKRHPLEDDRDADDNLIPDDLTNTQRFYRDIARAQERKTLRRF